MYSAIHREGEILFEAWIRRGFKEPVLEEWEIPWNEAGACAFTYAFIEWNDVLPWRGIAMPSKNVLMEKIREAIQSASRSDMKPILYEHRQAYGLIVPDFYWNAYEGDGRAFYENVLAQLAERLPLAFRIYSGPFVGSFKQLKRAYGGAKDAMQYKYLKHEDLIILHEEVEGAGMNFRQLDDELYRLLIQAVEERARDELSLAIERIFDHIRENRYSPEAMKAALVQCVLGIVKSIRSMEGDEKELASLKPILSSFGYNITWDELKRLFELFAFEASWKISKLKQINLWMDRTALRNGR